MSNLTQVIYVWPDYEWCYSYELADYDYKSDDYMEADVPTSADVQIIDEFAILLADNCINTHDRNIFWLNWFLQNQP